LLFDQRAVTGQIKPAHQCFVSGTVSRIDVVIGPTDVAVITQRQIANGFAHRGDPTALVLGPTGLAYVRNADTLYVASTLNNAIYTVLAPCAGRWRWPSRPTVTW
jgi:hypothetical protein